MINIIGMTGKSKMNLKIKGTKLSPISLKKAKKTIWYILMNLEC